MKTFITGSCSAGWFFNAHDTGHRFYAQPVGDRDCRCREYLFSQRKYYVNAHEQLGFGIFQFDRCSGLLSDEKRFDYPLPPAEYPEYHRLSYGTGSVFSPDEKLFYKTTKYSVSPTDLVPLGTMPLLFQFDLTAIDLAASIDTINIIDPLDYWPYNFTAEGFYGAELAPDGRIYIVHEGDSYCTVQYPNVRGRGCQFIHDKPYFGVTIGAAIPYMPNYRLGPLDGSPCDTLGLNNIPVANFRVDDSLGLLSRYFYDLSHHEPATWHWDFGDGASSTEQSALHSYDSAGIYNVCLTVSNPYGAIRSAGRCTLVFQAPTRQRRQLGVSISPNPFGDRLDILLQTSIHEPVFRLYDEIGRLVNTSSLVLGITEIKTGHLLPGVYYWEATAAGVRVKVARW